MAKQKMPKRGRPTKDLAGDVEIRFVQQRRRAEAVSGVGLPQVVPRQSMQLVVERREELLRGDRIAGIRLVDQVLHVVPHRYLAFPPNTTRTYYRPQNENVLIARGRAPPGGQPPWIR